MRKLALFFALTALIACRGDDDDDNPGADGGGDGTDGGADTMTVYDVQSEDMPVGTAVTLRGVVVTAIDTFGGRTGGIYVQEPEGGAYSGVFVFISGATAAELEPGDLVDIENGVKDEFALSDDETGRTLTEVSPAEGSSIRVEKVGDGTIPAPEVVVPWELAADDAEAEKWEGVLVQFDDVRVLSAPRNVSMSDSTLAEMDVTGPFAVSSSLTALLDQEIARGDCYASVVGIGDYFFSYKILPRTAADLTTGGDCMPEEATDELCTDEEDNDYNGFVDCADFGCGAVEACNVDTTVVDIQNETFDATMGRANLSGVVVTAIHDRGYWVQDAGAAAAYNGLYVFSFADEHPAGIAVGSTVDVSGQVTEFNTLTELTQVVADNVMPGEATAPLATSLADVTGANAEQYEGVLVTIPNVTVAMAADGTTFGQFTVTDGTDTLWVDDLVFAEAEAGQAANACISLTGVMHYNYQDDPEHVTLLPRSAEDIAMGDCP